MNDSVTSHESVSLIIAFSALFQKHVLHDSSEDSLKKITELVMLLRLRVLFSSTCLFSMEDYKMHLLQRHFKGGFEKCKSVSPLVDLICSNNHDKAFAQVFHLYRLLRTLVLATVKNNVLSANRSSSRPIFVPACDKNDYQH